MTDESMPEAGEGLAGKSLALFFTYGVSLQEWEEDGILDREVALYNELAVLADHVYLFTYGGEEERSFASSLAENVTVVPKRRISNDLLYSFLAPLIHRGLLHNVDIVKTNQMLGAWTALIAKIVCRAALVVRTGYVLSIFYEELEKPLPVRLLASWLETVAYFSADGVITSSRRGYEYVEERYRIRGIHLMLPNFIETEVFRPMDIEKRPDSLFYVGRLAPQKNLVALLEAVAETSYQLTLVGDGPQRSELERRARELSAQISFEGRIPNHELPEFMNEHKIFVLPSRFEGMPKTLLEAMACGLAVIGTDVEGINEVVTHGEDGVLCQTDAASIRTAIEELMADEGRRERLGAAARRTIEARYSLETIAVQEMAFYSRLPGGDVR